MTHFYRGLNGTWAVTRGFMRVWVRGSCESMCSANRPIQSFQLKMASNWDFYVISRFLLWLLIGRVNHETNVNLFFFFLKKLDDAVLIPRCLEWPQSTPEYSKFPTELLRLQSRHEKPLINRHYLRPPTHLVQRTRSQGHRPKLVCAPQTLEYAALQHTHQTFL